MTWSKFKLAVSRQQSAVSGLRKAISCQLLAISFMLTGCGIYSFNGTNIDPTVRTISIATIQNVTPQGPAFLTQRFTEDL